MQNEAPHAALTAIRDFLRGEGAGVVAWSTPATAIDRLFDLLVSRRRDDRFWVDLASLVRRLEDPRFTPLTAGGLAVVGPERIESIVTRLRAELPDRTSGTPRSRLLSWLCSTATAPAMLAFLLMGSAIGCADTCEDEAASHGIEGEQAEVYCELVGLVNDADIPWNIKINLLDCLPVLDTEERSWLLDAFGWASEDELAAILEDISTGWTCDDDWNLGADFGGH